MTDQFDDAQLEEARARLERLLAEDGVALSDPELWENPTEFESSLERIVPPAGTGGGRRWWLAGGIAAALGVVVLVAVAVLTADRGPDWEVTLSPTELAPQASARVLGWNTDGGTRLYVELDGLDPAPEGFVYEMWFTKDDRHISAGTFTGGDGVELSVGVRRGDFPRLWITLEPLDADPGPFETVLDTEA